MTIAQPPKVFWMRLNRAMVEKPTNQPDQPTVWQLVISHSYEDVKVLVPYLESKCERFVASEHEADEDISRTHVHFSLVNYKHSKVALTKEINKYWRGSDNFGILTSRPEGKGAYSEYHLGKYVGKGREDAFSNRGYAFGYTPGTVQEYVIGYNRDREAYNSQEIVEESDTTKRTTTRVISKIQYKLKVESPAQQKLRKNDQVKLIIQRMRERANAKGYPGLAYLSAGEVRDIIRELITEWQEVVGIYSAVELYDTVMMRTNPGRWNTMFDNILAKREPRN